MEDYSRQRHEEADYEFVYTPHITKGALYETSGHLDLVRPTGIFPPMHVRRGVRRGRRRCASRGRTTTSSRMNCPMHCLIFDARGRSYRELPLRLFESAVSTATRSPASSTV